MRQQVVEALGLETASGRLKVRWDENAQATAQGQIAFFIEFLTLTGECPLNYKSPNGSSRRDILGTWILSILSGHWRYAHVSAMRADGVNPRMIRIPFSGSAIETPRILAATARQALL